MRNPFQVVSVYQLRRRWKAGLLVFAVVIAAVTLWYTETLASNLRRREAREVDRWAMAIQHIVHAADEVDLSLATQIIENNESIPVLLVDDAGTIVSSRNVPWTNATAADTLAWKSRMAGRQHFGFKLSTDANGERVLGGDANGSLSFELAQFRLGPGTVPISIILYIDATFIKHGIPIRLP